MFSTLYGKLIAVLIGLGVGMAVMFIMIINYSDNMRRQYTNQVVFRTLAAELVNEHLLPDDPRNDVGAVEGAFDRLRMVNPRIDLHLLDEQGQVLASSWKSGIRKRDYVRLEPIDRFLAEDAQFPILGDDPREVSAQRVFSVTPILRDGRIDGYLYLILRGLRGDTVAEQIRNNYFLRQSVWLMGGGLVLALLAAALIVKLVTNRLRQLSRVVDRFQQSGFAEHPPYPLSRSARGDDIDHLAETFGQMADRIMSQMRELRQNDALRRELIANISHDLRTPLAALQGYLETLQVKGSTLSAEEKSGYLEIALKQSHQLGRLTGKLLELAKFDTGQVKITIEPFVLEDLVQDVVQQFELAAANKQVSLEAVLPEEMPLVAADIGMIDRVLKNLIENSLRYTPGSGTITVRLVPAAGHVTVEVADTGCGIESEDLPRIFDRFYRGEKNRGDESGNAGLGLAIAKRILELHGRSIAVTSRPGMTTFSFTLAFAETDNRSLPTEARAATESTQVDATLKNRSAAVI